MIERNQLLSGVPFVDEYFGAWAMYEPKFSALRQYAETINVQLHLQSHGTPEAREAKRIEARSSVAYEVIRGGIAVIELRGTLLKHASSFSGGTSTALVRRELRAAAQDDEVAGILLAIDSPGGTVAGIDDLAKDIAAAAAAKPVHAYAEDLCCSAAYWAGSQARRLSAGPTAIVGSIGVFNVVHDLSKMAEDQGVKVHVLKFGKYKGAATPGVAVTDEDLAKYQRLVDVFGEQFVGAVAGGRKLPTATVRELADGDVHIGAAALERKLVDAVESLDEAVRVLRAEITKSPGRAKGRAVDNSELKAALAQQRAAIEAACVGADQAFVAEQVAAGATADEASKAYTAKLAQENQALKAAAEKAKAEADEKIAEAEQQAAETAKGKGRGNPPIKQLADDDQDSQAEGAGEEFRAKVDELVAKGLTRQRAAAKVAKAHPQLREAMVAQANA